MRHHEFSMTLSASERTDRGRSGSLNPRRGFAVLQPVFLTPVSLGFAAVFILGIISTATAQSSPGIKCPPPARIDNVKETYGKTVVSDPYRWLEDQQSVETRGWIRAEDTCTDAALSKLPGRLAVSKRLGELYHTDSYSAPIERSGRYFFTKRLAGQDLSQIYMRRSRTGPDEILIDPLAWSKDHSVSVELEDVSRDGKLLFYGRREGGQDEVTLHALDVDGHHDLPDVLPSATYFGVSPAPDDRGIYFTKATPNGPRAYYHAMGSDPAQDKMIYGNVLGKETILSLALSDNGRYVVYVVSYGSASDKTDIYIQDVQKQGPVVTVVNDIPSRFFPYFAGNRLYIQTNWKAPNQHVYVTDLSAPSRDHWREVIPETPETLDNFAPIGGELVAEYLHNATSEIVISDADGKNRKSLPLSTLGTAEISGRWESPEVFYTFTSFNYPTTNFLYDLSTSRTSIWSKLNVPIDPTTFETEQVWYESKGKTRVSMFLFHEKGLKLDGNNPVLLYGYGGFDVSRTPAFSPLTAVWVEHGGIFALANLRGGGEYGEEWHRAGMFEKKQNVFDDFISAAEYLIAKKYTVPSKLAIMGESNGGLLVGAVLTQRPDLYRAVVCGYPLLDMIRYQKFMEASYWVSEYGSSDDPEQFGYLYKYSPYQNVVNGTKYPSVLFITGDGDTRVAPLHARKMAARLQAATGSELPVLLLYDTKSGHSGGRPISKIIEEQTNILSFLFWQLGMPAQ
jgi:prolyl oligopeptidase